jgi:hypothetical protein
MVRVHSGLPFFFPQRFLPMISCLCCRVLVLLSGDQRVLLVILTCVSMIGRL